MKISFRAICPLLLLLLAFCLFLQPAQTQAASESDLTFTLNDDGQGYSVTSFRTTASGSLTIPETHNGKPVTTIGKNAFRSCSSLTSVTIPDSVTTIGYGAFEHCSSLTSVTIGDSVTSIGNYAFYYCKKLTSVTIGDSVTTIGDFAFSECSNLTSVTIPDSVTTIGGTAFFGCSKLHYNLYDNGMYLGNTANPYHSLIDITSDSITSIQIHDQTKVIADSTFEDCSSLTSVTIGDSVTSIGSFAFYECSNLISVTIPDNVTSIGNHAFGWCTSLTSVTIGDSVTSIGDYAFYYCKKLTSVTIGDSVTTIGDSVTTIGDFAFDLCSSLTSVTIPSSVTIIGDYAFHNCTRLKDAYYLGTEVQWNAIEIAVGNTHLLNATIHFSAAESTPEFTQHPQAAIVEEGEKATFAIAFSGDVYLYRWQYSTNGGKLWYNASSSTAGYNTDTLTVVGTEARNGFMYRCKITDKSGNVYYSDAATLTVKKPGLSFVSHPADETVKLGNRAAFTVKVDGEVKAYQWQYQMVENGPWWNCTPYTMGYNTTILNVIAAEKREGFLYRCRVTDNNGNKFYSNTAELTVDIPETYAVLSQPQNAWVMSGKKTTFHIDTQGEGLTYQWEYHKGVDKTGPEYYWIAMGSTTGCKTDTLTIAGVSGSTNRNGWAYRCVVTDKDGYIYTTDHAFLYVTTAQITSQPADQAVLTGSKATFAVKTEGTVKSYQWQYSKNGGKNWFNSSSATQGYNTATLTVEATAARNGFMYRCIVTDSDGNKIESHAATLSVANVVLVSQPTGVTTAEGSNAVFSVTVEGNVKSYRWQYSNNGGKIWYNSSSATQGYNTDTLTVEATAARNGFLYRCVITDSEGNKITSEAAKLTVQ